VGWQPDGSWPSSSFKIVLSSDRKKEILSFSESKQAWDPRNHGGATTGKGVKNAGFSIR
jgi:hypothetical protein